MLKLEAIADCDILSTFAKIDRIDLLYNLFSKVVMPYAVYSELKNIQKRGFDFPEKVFGRIDLTVLDKKEIEYFKRYIQHHNIHHGESEGLAMAKNRNAIFLTNDRAVMRFCEKENIPVLDIKDILRKLAQKRLESREEMNNILKDIKNKDYLVIKEKQEIMAEYE